MRRVDPTLILAGVLALIATGIVFAPSRAQGQSDSAAVDRSRGVVAIGRDLRVEQAVGGSVQVLGGSISIGNRVEGSVIAFGADVRLEPDARIEGDLFCLGGTLSGLTPLKVAGGVYAPGSVSAAIAGVPTGSHSILEAARDPFSLVTVALKVSVLLVWFLIALVLMLVRPHQVRLSAVEVRASPFHTFFLGLVAFTSFVLTAIVFSYLIPYRIGILLLAVLGVFAVVTKIYGMIAIFHAVGWIVAGPRTHQAALQRRWFKGDLSMVLVGLLVLGAVRMIPIIGNVVWMTASLAGVGVALSTRFGTREPAFLAWRPAGGNATAP